MSETQNYKIKFKKVVDVELKPRTADVQSNKSFNQLMIRKEILASLKRKGYKSPSPVQAEAIPNALLGLDLLVQAKTGTGKTLVFAVAAANEIYKLYDEWGDVESMPPRVIVLAPTREIALQDYEELQGICPGRIGLFIGGTNPRADVKLLREGCQVIVGTCGRIVDLIDQKELKTHTITLIVLDEADKLMEESFVDAICYISSSIQHHAQMLVFSATYPRKLDRELCNYMRDPTLIRVSSGESNSNNNNDGGSGGGQPLGLMQYALFVPKSDPHQLLFSIFNSIFFTQCIIFRNDYDKCKDTYDRLAEKIDKKCISILSGEMPQPQRTKTFNDFKQSKTKFLIATDVAARGIDVPNVDLVVNLGCPMTCESYVHRAGRAGRYGTYGAVITILGGSLPQFDRLRNFVNENNLEIKMLQLSSMPAELTQNIEYYIAARNLLEMHNAASNNQQQQPPQSISPTTVVKKTEPAKKKKIASDGMEQGTTTSQQLTQQQVAQISDQIAQNSFFSKKQQNEQQQYQPPLVIFATGKQPKRQKKNPPLPLSSSDESDDDRSKSKSSRSTVVEPSSVNAKDQQSKAPVAKQHGGFGTKKRNLPPPKKNIQTKSSGSSSHSSSDSDEGKVLHPKSKLTENNAKLDEELLSKQLQELLGSSSDSSDEEEGPGSSPLKNTSDQLKQLNPDEIHQNLTELQQKQEQNNNVVPVSEERNEKPGKANGGRVFASSDSTPRFTPSPERPVKLFDFRKNEVPSLGADGTRGHLFYKDDEDIYNIKCHVDDAEKEKENGKNQAKSMLPKPPTSSSTNSSSSPSPSEHSEVVFFTTAQNESTEHHVKINQPVKCKTPPAMVSSPSKFTTSRRPSSKFSQGQIDDVLSEEIGPYHLYDILKVSNVIKSKDDKPHQKRHSSLSSVITRLPPLTHSSRVNIEPTVVAKESTPDVINVQNANETICEKDHEVHSEAIHNVADLEYIKENTQETIENGIVNLNMYTRSELKEIFDKRTKNEWKEELLSREFSSLMNFDREAAESITTLDSTRKTHQQRNNNQPIGHSSQNRDQTQRTRRQKDYGEPPGYVKRLVKEKGPGKNANAEKESRKDVDTGKEKAKMKCSAMEGLKGRSFKGIKTYRQYAEFYKQQMKAFEESEQEPITPDNSIVPQENDPDHVSESEYEDSADKEHEEPKVEGQQIVLSSTNNVEEKENQPTVESPEMMPLSASEMVTVAPDQFYQQVDFGPIIAASMAQWNAYLRAMNAGIQEIVTKK